MTCWYSGYNLGSDAQQSPVIFSPKHPGYFCGPHSLIFSRCLDSLPSVECPGHEANDSPRHRVPRLRMTAATPPFPLCTFRACKWALLLIVYVATFERVPHQLDWQFSIYQLLVDLLQWLKLLPTAVACTRHSTTCPGDGTAHLQYSHYGLWHSALTISNSSSKAPLSVQLIEAQYQMIYTVLWI
jgi:hypothetical protein